MDKKPKPMIDPIGHNLKAYKDYIEYRRKVSKEDELKNYKKKYNRQKELKSKILTIKEELEEKKKIEREKRLFTLIEWFENLTNIEQENIFKKLKIV